jgi:hypothetical protein
MPHISYLHDYIIELETFWLLGSMIVPKIVAKDVL